MKKGRVVVIGGGVAGMTVAHELSERGFSVIVLEKRIVPGGKARSTEVAGSAMGTRAALPGEHGFRFFPGFYRHLPETFARIPMTDGSGKTVLDHLVPVSTMTFAFSDRPPFTLPARFPRSLEEVGQMLGFFEGMGQLGITVDDLVFTWWKLWQALSSSKKRRLAELEPLAWWKFMQADEQSEPFRRLLVIGLTRNLVASRAEEANARTVSQAGTQLLLDLVRRGAGADRILDGPTNDVWIEPWLRKLEADGVQYRTGVELERIDVDPTTKRVTSVTIRVRREPTADPTEALLETVEGDDFVLAVPVEVAANLLRRQPELLVTAPGLAGILTLGEEHVEWMNGIQFYLTERVDLARGHINLVDSPWALTAISQSQFWPDFPAEGFGDGSVKTVLSVDISAWDRPGTVVKKEAWDCTFEEIGRECLAQLKAALNQEREVLRDDMLHPVYPYNLDDDIAERVDKQRTRPPGGRRRGPSRKDRVIHDGKPDLLTNAEPLLVNVEDSWKLRPKVTTEIDNLFLASDYVRTTTNLATMEAANEAGRRATNAILLKRDAGDARAKVFPLDEPCARLRARDALRFRRGEAWKNPFWIDWGVKVGFVVGASVLRTVAWFAALPRPLYPIMAGYAGLMWLFWANLDAAYAGAWLRACALFDAAQLAAPAACAHALPIAPSAPARAAFFYAAYMLLFGVSVYVMPRSVLARLGFPRERGPWLPLLGAMPVVIAMLYAFSALFEVREFFWLSVIGRTSVFLYVLWLTFGRGVGTTLLLLMALPDLASALWSAWLLAPTNGAGALTCLGIVNIVLATTFSLFPGRLLRAFGFPETPSGWSPMVAILLGIWGAYEVLSVVLRLDVLLVAATLGHFAFGGLCLVAPFVYAQRQGPFARGYRLWLVGAAYVASALWALAQLRV